MSSQTDTSGNDGVSHTSKEEDPDSGLEFSVESAETASLQPHATEYWYSKGDSASPIGPVSLTILRKQLLCHELNRDDLVWRTGMPDWIRVEQHAELQDVVAHDATIIGRGPPVLPNRNPGSMEKEKIDSIPDWIPSPKIYRHAARCVLLIGIAILLLSVILLPFGFNSFVSGLLIVLIAVGLELAAVARDAVVAMQASSSIPERLQEKLDS